VPGRLQANKFKPQRRRSGGAELLFEIPRPAIGTQTFSGALTYAATARLAWELAGIRLPGNGECGFRGTACVRLWNLQPAIHRDHRGSGLESPHRPPALAANEFPQQLGRPEIAANLADPDQDGLENIWEFIHGTDPQAAGSRSAPVGSIIGDRLALTFPRNPDGTDLSLVVQAADSMDGPWLDLATSTAAGPFTATAPGATVTETPSGAMFRVEVKDTYFTNDPAHRKRFMRLEARY